MGLEDSTILLHDVEVSYLCCYLNVTLITSQLEIPPATVLYEQNVFFSNLLWDRFRIAQNLHDAVQTANLLSEHSAANRDGNPFLLVMSFHVKLTMDR